MSFRNAFRWSSWTCWLAIGIVGCSSPANHARTGKSLTEVTSESGDFRGETADSTAPANKFRWDGGGVVLGEVDQPALTVSEFRVTLTELYDQQRERSFQNLVRRYPDIACETLQSMNAESLGNPVLRKLAECLDEYLSPDTPFFSPAFQTSDGSWGPYWDKRAKCWQAIQSGEPAMATKLNLLQHKPRPPATYLRLEDIRLVAIAHMMAGQSESAMRLMEQGVDEFQSAPRYVLAKMWLLQGEMYRHAGQHDKWRASWQQAVKERALLVNTAGIADPQFWHRAAFARPSQLSWPMECIEPLRAYLTQHGVPFRIDADLGTDYREAIVWGAVGLMHLDRDEGQSAVLCFKKAEALIQDRPVAGALQLYQARGLIGAGQPGPASSILIRIIGQHPGADLAGRAQAILGAIKVQNGAIDQGNNLLELALANSDHWPDIERQLAQADLALVKLMSGQTEEGLQGLESAYELFAQSQRWDHAYQCLWNMARFHELTQHDDLHHQAQLRLAAFESVR